MNDLLEKAKEAIDRLRELIKSHIQRAEQILGERLKIIRNKADEIIAKTEKAIHDEIQKIKENIDKIKKEAEILGVDVKECMSQHDKELEDLGKSIIKKMLQCINEEIQKAGDIVKDAVNNIIKIKDDILNFTNNLEKCKTEQHTVKCVADVLSEVVKDITGIPTMIQVKINEIMNLLNNIEADLANCAMRKLIEITKEAGEVGITIAKCVAEKIRED